MKQEPTVILLADDDEDDCFLFKEILDELPIRTTLITLKNGVELMNFLANTNELPDVLFLDMNMPCMNGLDCLKQIRLQDSFRDLCIIIYSTSYDRDIARALQNLGADFYIQKQSEFSALKIIIFKALQFIEKSGVLQPDPDMFVLSEE